MAIASLKRAFASMPPGDWMRTLRRIFNAQRSSFLSGSAVTDVASIAAAAGASSTITVTGAALGDFALVSGGVDLQGMSLTAYVSAANTVTFRLHNGTAGAIDLASTTWRAIVVKKDNFSGSALLGMEPNA